jgi:hypothetical protein
VQVYIKYIGMLKDGNVVESNVNEKPYKFKLGNILSTTLIFALNHEFLMSHNRSPLCHLPHSFPPLPSRNTLLDANLPVYRPMLSSMSSHPPSSLSLSSCSELLLLVALTRPSLASSAADVTTCPQWTTIYPRAHESMHPAHNIFYCKINLKALGKDSFEK